MIANARGFANIIILCLDLDKKQNSDRVSLCRLATFTSRCTCKCKAATTQHAYSIKFKGKHVVTFFADCWIINTVVHNTWIHSQSDWYLAIMITVIKLYLEKKEYLNNTSAAVKDIRTNCFCSSLLCTQIHMPRHARAQALSNKMNNDN